MPGVLSSCCDRTELSFTSIILSFDWLKRWNADPFTMNQWSPVWSVHFPPSSWHSPCCVLFCLNLKSSLTDLKANGGPHSLFDLLTPLAWQDDPLLALFQFCFPWLSLKSRFHFIYEDSQWHGLRTLILYHAGPHSNFDGSGRKVT